MHKRVNRFLSILFSCLALTGCSDQPQSNNPCSTLCGGASNGCYDNVSAMTAGCATLQDGNESTANPTIINFTKADPSCTTSCFYVWQDSGSTKILNSTGLWQSPGVVNYGQWQQRYYTADNGNGRDLVDAAEIAQLDGRVCPYLTPGAGVFFQGNMTQTGKCLYYDKGNPAQRLDAFCSVVNCQDYLALEATSFLYGWDRFRTNRNENPSYYEGNIETCRVKGMRLPTMYESSMGVEASNLPGGDLLSAIPTFAGSNGVPSVVGSSATWTASANGSSGLRYWVWSATANNSLNYSDTASVRCVLP